MESQFDETKLFRYNHAELAAYIASLPSLPNSTSVIPLSPNLLAKRYRVGQLEDARASMEFASRFGIPVPRIHLSVKVEDIQYAIMNRIPGRTLEEAWPGLSWATSI
jgi:hypothetical protein